MVRTQADQRCSSDRHHHNKKPQIVVFSNFCLNYSYFLIYSFFEYNLGCSPVVDVFVLLIFGYCSFESSSLWHGIITRPSSSVAAPRTHFRSIRTEIFTMELLILLKGESRTGKQIHWHATIPVTIISILGGH